MKRAFLAASTAALLLSVAANAQTQQAQQNDILQQMLGAMFGTTPQATDQTLESDWNQGRRPFGQRREQLDARIDAAVRDGSISRGEAEQIRAEYDDIVRLEERYSADGNVSPQQRQDLRARYRAMSQRVGDGNYGQDGYQQGGRWVPLSTRSSAFEQQINAGLRNRTLSQTEANRLRNDWRALAQVEANYQRGGLDSREQADLWARYNAIDDRMAGSIGGFGNDRNPVRWSQMETRLATAERNGRISRNDAVQLRAQLGDLARLDAAYANGGYSSDQRAYLTRRYAELDGILSAYRR
jgi:hypothetical protein